MSQSQSLTFCWLLSKCRLQDLSHYAEVLINLACELFQSCVQGSVLVKSTMTSCQFPQDTPQKKPGNPAAVPAFSLHLLLPESCLVKRALQVHVELRSKGQFCADKAHNALLVNPSLPKSHSPHRVKGARV